MPGSKVITNREESRYVGITSEDELKVSMSTATPDSFQGTSFAVGTSPVEVSFTGTIIAMSVQSANTNTGTIFIGGASIDQNGNNSIAEINAGELFSMDFDDTSEAVYVVSSAANQLCRKAGLK